MEEDIDYLKRHIKAIGKTRSTQAIENLINKYKEQEEQIEEYKLNVKEAMHEAQENARIFRREQAKANEYKKMIELMAEAFKQDDIRSKEEIIEFFRKKAKGE